MNNLIENYTSQLQEKYEKALELIKKYDRIVIFRHRVPDFDALGTQLGFKAFLEENFPDKEIRVVGDDHIKFTPRLFQEMEIIDDSYFEDPFLAIICDVNDLDRVADERVSKASDTIVFDHHPAREIYGTVNIIDTSLAAASELVTTFMVWTGLKINEEAAKNLYIALVGDSGRFLYSSTTSLTFAVAQVLIGTGININSIYLNMYENSIDDLKIQSYILSHFEVSKNGVAYYILTEEVMQQLGLNQLNAKAFVNMFANIKEINVWCSISEDVIDSCWRISIRSKKVDISGIANKYQGGGHAQASGARLDSLDELSSFINDLDEVIANDK